MAENQTTEDWLDTGEPIHVDERPDGKFQARVYVSATDGHYAVGDTAQEARDRLHSYVAELRRRRPHV